MIGESAPDPQPVMHGDVVPAAPELPDMAVAALAAAQALARNASAAATLRAYKADWQHFADWCAARNFVSVPATPATGKMHRFNDLAWNPAHRDIQGPLQGLLRTHGRPPQKAAALTLAMLRQLVATCDASARGRRDRALLLFGFAGALRRSELVALQVEDVAAVAGGLRLRITRAKTDQVGQGAEIGLPRQTRRNLSGAGVRRLAGGRQTPRRPAVPPHQHRRPHRRHGAASRRRAPDSCPSHPDGRDHRGGVRSPQRPRAARRLHHRSL